MRTRLRRRCGFGRRRGQRRGGWTLFWVRGGVWGAVDKRETFRCAERECGQDLIYVLGYGGRFTLESHNTLSIRDVCSRLIDVYRSAECGLMITSSRRTAR